MNRPQAILALATSLVVGCGKYTDPGNGSHTLAVQAQLTYHFGTGRTAVAITIDDQNQAPVTDATVTVKDPDQKTTTPVPFHNQDTYTVNLDGWHRRIELAISRPSAADSLGAKLEGPGPHRIKDPAQGTLVTYGDLGTGLDVTWVTDDGLKADQVTVSLNRSNYSDVLVDDTGGLTIPKLSLQPAIGDTETVDVVRQNQVTLAGGIVGSTMTLSYQIGNDFNLQP